MTIAELFTSVGTATPDLATVANLAHSAAEKFVAELARAVPDVFAATPKPKGINTEGVVKFLLSRIAPIFLAVLGLIFIGRAGKGEVSKVVTSSAIAIVGLAFIGGALALIFLGQYLVDLFFT